MIWTATEWTGERVTTKSLAARLDVSAADGVADRPPLTDQGLVEHAPYGVTLTEAGRRPRSPWFAAIG